MTIAPPAISVSTSPTSLEDVFFDEVGKNQWRVLDGRVSRGDITALLGFVCIVADIYEVTLMATPRETAVCADMNAARTAFLTSP